MSIFLYIVTGLCLLASLIKDKKKTKMALKKAWKSLGNIMPQFIGIIILVGLILAYFDEGVISNYIGKESGFLGVIVSALVGAITLLPGFVAFPTAALLVDNGAGYVQIAAFVSSLMMVGIVTYPVEKKFFNRKFTIMRNLLAFGFSIVIALIMGVIFYGFRG